MTTKTNKFAVSHLKDSEWKPRGLRSFLEYRDLGVADATEGRFGASVARAIKSYEPGGGTPRHSHDLGFHLIYILKGWLRTEFEGVGEIVMNEGDCIAYEGEVPQEHIEYSGDYEVLQITMPAEFKTEPVAD